MNDRSQGINSIPLYTCQKNQIRHQKKKDHLKLCTNIISFILLHFCEVSSGEDQTFAF